MDLLLGMCFWGMKVPEWFVNTSFVISLYLVFTMIFAYSPLYQLFDFNTKEERQ